MGFHAGILAGDLTFVQATGGVALGIGCPTDRETAHAKN